MRTWFVSTFRKGLLMTLFLSLGQRENWLPTLAKQTTLTAEELKAEGK
jgi:homospermidine synthase